MFFSADLLTEFASLWFQAPIVMSGRLQALALTGALTGPVDVTHMMTEKFAATLESISAVQVAMATEGMEACASVAAGTCVGFAGASERVAVAALKPYGKRVRANMRDLTI